MEKRVELEKRGRNPAEIKELNLDNCRSTSIIGLTDEFSNLETLSLSNVGLTSLKGFPKLPNLKKLELSDNRISNGLNLLETSPKLTHLNLSNNRIKEFVTLEPLKSLKNLINLDLFNNEATSIENYREKICKMIPTLQYLDGYDLHDGDTDDDEVNGNDDDSEDDASSVEDEELDDGCNLRMVYEPKLDDTSDDEADYEVGEEDEDDDIVEEEEFDDTTEEEAQSEVPRGKKRKLEDGEGN